MTRGPDPLGSSPRWRTVPGGSHRVVGAAWARAQLLSLAWIVRFAVSRWMQPLVIVYW